MKRLALNTLLVLFCVIYADAYGEEKLRFGTFPIPHLVLDENHGNFVELTRAIFERAHLVIEIVVKPAKRTLHDFQQNKIDAIFPALDVNFSSENKPIKSDELIFLKKDYVFTRKGEPFLKTIKDLEGKRVGITLGYPYAKELTDNPLIKIESALTDEHNVLKLIKNRSDAFVVEEVAGLKAFQSKAVADKIQYDPASPISEMGVYYAFQNTEKGKRLAKMLSKVLGEMKKDGTYSKIINKGLD